MRPDSVSHALAWDQDGFRAALEHTGTRHALVREVPADLDARANVAAGLEFDVAADRHRPSALHGSALGSYHVPPDARRAGDEQARSGLDLDVALHLRVRQGTGGAGGYDHGGQGARQRPGVPRPERASAE